MTLQFQGRYVTFVTVSTPYNFRNSAPISNLTEFVYNISTYYTYISFDKLRNFG